MSYEIDFSYTFMPENPDSLLEDVAWRARIYSAKHGLIASIRNFGMGTDVEWHDEPGKDVMTKDADAMFPDSIDALRDFIDYTIQEHRANQTF